MIRALIPAPWLTIGALALSGAGVLGIFGGYAFTVSGLHGDSYFSYTEWCMYLCTIAAIGACVPSLRAVDLGCRRARLATLMHGVLAALLSIGAAGVGVYVINLRRAARAAQYITSAPPPGSEHIIVGTITTAGVALALIALLGAGLGTAASVVVVVVFASVNILVSEEFPLPVPSFAYQGTWWQPVSVAESIIIFLIGCVVWGVFGGARKVSDIDQD
ncbi:hypothetical protein P4N68_01640 [Corynebacterium felinum]|uniref:Uncharacterized protein n=1 Tax=Corynebacterium felinum TaxID=131318 RepID=A0ABU2BAE1_9CORY|nr:hypothetical protein [Corynebacterium felinum]MDF5819782.1 hypothetical protein [Corynebacterium felinum]MDR7354349.1 hypothetical protein [Corynebacterium felinum]WJY93723.1 hypothetical protein CFELI_00320 [Corynebacterium felinum]